MTGPKSDTFWQYELRAVTFYFAEPQFSADNAAGIALLTFDKYNG